MPNKERLVDGHVSEERKGRRERLKDSILHRWKDLLAVEKPQIPNEIREIAGDKVPEAALILLWMLPTPWLFRDSDDLQSDRFDAFWDQGPSRMWKDDYKEQVIDYFTVIFDESSSKKFKK